MQRLRPDTKTEIPIFILVLFHYQLFLLVSKSIVFPGRLWAKEDLDNTLETTANAEDAWPCLVSLKLCICKANCLLHL